MNEQDPNEGCLYNVTFAHVASAGRTLLLMNPVLMRGPAQVCGQLVSSFMWLLWRRCVAVVSPCTYMYSMYSTCLV